VKATGHPAPQPKKRRTTLTPPVDSLSQAERIARSRKVSVATVISEVLSEGLQIQGALDRSDQIFASYRQAFSAFSDDEVALLDGITMEPTRNRRRGGKRSLARYYSNWRRADVGRRDPIRKAAVENARVAWLAAMGKVLPFDGAVAVVAGEIMASLPEPPSPDRNVCLDGVSTY